MARVPPGSLPGTLPVLLCRLPPEQLLVPVSSSALREKPLVRGPLDPELVRRYRRHERGPCQGDHYLLEERLLGDQDPQWRPRLRWALIRLQGPLCDP